MSTHKAMNHGNNAVAADQANVSVPMPDEQMAPNGGLSVSFTFPIDSLTAAAKSDGMNMMKSADDYLRADGPDVKASGHDSAMPTGSGN